MKKALIFSMIGASLGAMEAPGLKRGLASRLPMPESKRNTQKQEALEQLKKLFQQEKYAQYKLLTNSGQNLDAQDKDGYTALIIAARQGDAQLVRLLLNAGVDADIVDEYGWTALIGAIYSLNAPELVKLLLDGDANANIVIKRERTPLMIATSAGRTGAELLKLLLDAHANVDAQDIEGNTALMEAAMGDEPKMVTVLLQGGADPRIRNKYGLTALDLAKSYGGRDVTKALRGTEIFNRLK